ncbi:amidohydrolase [Flavobacterium sp. TAB 87]|uniref:amidohydrolase n=1 Tax=Flavobacterium sp. TAB 87 TaxID=1729581 RepID=UPI00076BE39A|nr:amidohydrolase [Flavobacterium sp. TAB 87]KVV13744.1 N-substituted formamide deformylase precursor [Flavobacterium sp. TAB 87]
MKKIIYVIVLFSLFSCKEDKAIVSQNSKLFYNGDILTMEGDEPTYAEAVVVENGKIVWVGSKTEVQSKYKNSEEIDLKGHTLLPGFIDPHSHFGMVSNTMGQVDLNPEPVGTVKNIDDILDNLKKYKEKNNIADGEWIFGWGYDDGQLAEKRHPNKKDIDKVLPNNPVYLQHTSGHMGVANTMGLEKLKISARSKNPDGGNIDRFPNSQEPTGLVQETAMYPFVRGMLEILGSKQAEYFDTTQNYYASNGITTAQDGMTDRNTIRFFQSQADSGKFKIDLISLAGYSELDSNLADTSLRFKTYKNGFKVQGTKIVADGSPQGKTAFFSKPFLTEVPGCHHDCRGLPSLTQDALNKLFETAYNKDNQLFIHCNGDATIDMALLAHKNACEKLKQPLDKDRRTIIIHSQFARPDQLQLFVKYNLQPSFFTNHAYFWGDVHVQNLGKERADFLSPMVTAKSLGLKPTNHSDATVTPINPIFTVWTAVNRVSRSGAVIGLAERTTPYFALQAITSFAAYEFFDENLKGTLTTGKLADFVLLDKNPLKVDPMEIKNIQVLETIKEGKTIFKK